MSMATTILGESTIKELAKDWMEMSESGRGSIDCESFTRNKIVTDFDDEVVDYVDSQPGQNYDYVVAELVYEVAQETGLQIY